MTRLGYHHLEIVYDNNAQRNDAFENFGRHEWAAAALGGLEAKVVYKGAGSYETGRKKLWFFKEKKPTVELLVSHPVGDYSIGSTLNTVKNEKISHGELAFTINCETARRAKTLIDELMTPFRIGS